MADKEKNVVLNFKMDGQVKYAETLRDINAVMNTAAKEYKNHISAMGDDAKATDKLAAEKKKLEIQMEAARKRTGMLRAQYEAMSKDTKTTTGQLTQMYGKLLDAEKAEIALEKSLGRVNDGLTDQAQEARDAQDTLDGLKSESQILEAEQKKLTSSFKLQTSQLGDNATESEKAELAQKQLASQMKLTDRSVANLEQQLEATKKVYGDNSVEVMQMETRLNDARNSISKFNKSLDSIEDSSKAAEGSLDRLKGGMQGLAGAAGAVAVGGLVEGMKETNQQLASLEIQAGNANLAMSDFDGARNNFVAVGQDVGQTTEAMGNLVQAGYDTEESLSEISEGISGAIVKYGETFTSEGLAESINTTTQLGEVTGQLTDLLEKEGVNVEDFNEKLEGMGSASERANFLSQTFSDQGLNSMYNKYVEMNPEITKNAESQLAMQDAMSELSVILTPIITEMTEFTTKIIEWANENPKLTMGIAALTVGLGALIAAATVLAPIVTAVGVASGGASVGVGALSASLLPIIGIVLGVIAAITAIILVIKNWGAITDWLGEKWNQFTSWLSENVPALAIRFVGWINDMKQGAINKFTDLVTGGVEKFNALRTLAGNVITGFRNDAINKASDLKTSFINKANELKDGAVSRFNNLRDKAGSVMEATKNKIINPIESAKNRVGEIVDKIIGFFSGLGSKLKFEIPKPKMPSFDLEFASKTFFGKTISYPTGFDVDWHARAAVFTHTESKTNVKLPVVDLKNIKGFKLKGMLI